MFGDEGILAVKDGSVSCGLEKRLDCPNPDIHGMVGKEGRRSLTIDRYPFDVFVVVVPGRDCPCGGDGLLGRREVEDGSILDLRLLLLLFPAEIWKVSFRAWKAVFSRCVTGAMETETVEADLYLAGSSRGTASVLPCCVAGSVLGIDAVFVEQDDEEMGVAEEEEGEERKGILEGITSFNVCRAVLPILPAFATVTATKEPLFCFWLVDGIPASEDSVLLLPRVTPLLFSSLSSSTSCRIVLASVWV